MTRIQQERFASEEEYLAQKGAYILDKKKMKLAKPDMIVLHPLPRVDEIAIEVDDDPRAMYFKQARYGMFVRMALILTVLHKNGTPPALIRGREHKSVNCSNPRCITHREQYLPHFFEGSGDILTCEYCDQRTLI